MNTFKLLLKKLVIFFMGLLIIQTGVALFLQISIGTDPFTIFTNGIAKLFNINVGNGNLLLSIFFTLTVIFLLKGIKQINIGTLIALLFAGVFINIMNYVLEPLNLSSYGLLTKMIFVVLSCLLIAIGFSLEKSANLGVAPNDLFILLFTEKVNIEYRWVRIVIDLTFTIIGFLLCGIDTIGTTLGIGTIITALVQGPMIQFFMGRIEKIINPFISEEKDETMLTA